MHIYVHSVNNVENWSMSIYYTYICTSSLVLYIEYFLSAANYRASVLAAEGLEQDQDRTKNAGGRAALGNRTPEETDGGSDKARESQQVWRERVYLHSYVKIFF